MGLTGARKANGWQVEFDATDWTYQLYRTADFLNWTLSLELSHARGRMVLSDYDAPTGAGFYACSASSHDAKCAETRFGRERSPSPSQAACGCHKLRITHHALLISHHCAFT